MDAITISIIITFPIIFVGVLMVLSDTKRLRDYSEDEFQKTYNAIDDITDAYSELEERVNTLTHRVVCNENTIANLQGANYDLDKRLYEHINEHLGIPRSDVPNDEKDGQKWSLLKKNDCKEFIRQSGQKLSFNEMSIILGVPATTLKRWNKEIERENRQ